MSSIFSKVIKRSKRGITFSDKRLNECFPKGTGLSLLINKNERSVTIVKAGNDLHVSRKLSGKHEKPLVDIRKASVTELFEDWSHVQINVFKEKIEIVGVDLEQASGHVAAVSSEESLVYLTDWLEVKAVSSHQGIERGSLASGMGMISEDLLGKKNRPYDINEILTMASYCCGAGFLDYNFKREGFNIKFACDINEAYVNNYRKNVYTGAKRLDMRELIRRPKEKIVKAVCAVAGIDCRPVSSVNRVKREEQHESYDLVEHYARLIIKQDAKVFVYENVPGAAKTNVFKRAMETLKKAGYAITKAVLNAAEYGDAQFRDRLIVLGSRLGCAIPLPEKTHDEFNYRTVGQAFNSITPDATNQIYTNCRLDTTMRMKFIPAGGNYEDIPMEHRPASMRAQNGKAMTHSNRYYRLERDKPSIPIVNPRKAVIIHPDEDRIVTPREAMTLFSAPNDFSLLGSKSDIEQMIANAVPMNLARAIARTVKRYLLDHMPKVTVY